MKKTALGIAIACLVLSTNVMAQGQMQYQPDMSEAQLKAQNALYVTTVFTSQGRAKVYRASNSGSTDYFVLPDGKVYDSQKSALPSMSEAQLKAQNALYVTTVFTPQGKAKVYRVSNSGSTVNYYVLPDGKVYK